MVVYDVLNNQQVIQTDLTKNEIQDLFDIDAKIVHKMCYFGFKFMGQYEVIEVEQDEPVPIWLAHEWDTYIEKLRRRLHS